LAGDLDEGRTVGARSAGGLEWIAIAATKVIVKIAE